MGRVQEKKAPVGGVSVVVTVPGYNVIEQEEQPRAGVAFVVLEPWSERKSPELAIDAIMKRMQVQLSQIADAVVAGLASGDTSGARLGAWGPAFNEGVDRMRRLVCEYYDGFSFGRMIKQYPEMRGTVTDLLIGDLFDPRVDKVWGPLESLYPADKSVPLSWNAGTPAEIETLIKSL